MPTPRRTTPAKVTAPMRRVLAAIAAGTPWRAAHETVEAILVAGLASYDDNGWRITAPVGAPKARRHAPDCPCCRYWSLSSDQRRGLVYPAPKYTKGGA